MPINIYLNLLFQRHKKKARCSQITPLLVSKLQILTLPVFFYQETREIIVKMLGGFMLFSDCIENNTLIKNSLSVRTILDEALYQISLAKNAMNDLEHDIQSRSTKNAISALNEAAELLCKRSEAETGDLINLCFYITDRLSIKHSTLGIHPLIEAQWLIKNLIGILTKNH